jgi:hypothetical protein
MLMRLLAWGTLIWLGCVGSVWGLHPKILPPPEHVAVLLPDEDCPAPCWEGIRPGKTSFKTAFQILADWLPPGEEKNTWLLTAGDSVQRVALNDDVSQVTLQLENVTLGDLILALGAPDFQVPLLVIDARQLTENRELDLYYVDEQLIATVSYRDGERLSPELSIVKLRYQDVSRTARPNYMTQPWRGFVENVEIGG